MELTLNASTATHSSKLRTMLFILSLSMLYALSAWIAIPLPFSPVPVSFTSHVILFSCAFFGRRAAYATLAYLAEGAMGLPVFSHGGSGVFYLLGPTGGYLMGWLIASFTVALLSERMQRREGSKLFGLLLASNSLFFVFGLPYLALFTGWSKALSCGLYPFIATDLFKTMAVSRILSKVAAK